MKKIIDKHSKKWFKKNLLSKQVYQEAVAEGLDINKYYEEVMSATLDIPYDELVEGSLLNLINATRKIGIYLQTRRDV